MTDFAFGLGMGLTIASTVSKYGPAPNGAIVLFGVGTMLLAIAVVLR